jgi:tetratricopeptide (TPR) repeat protein
MSQTRHLLRCLIVLGVVTLVGGCGLFSHADREVTCHSDAAYAAYREGLDQSYRFHPEKAFDAFENATRLDPEFPMAELMLAGAATSLGKSDFADSVLSVAYEQRHVATPVEQLLIERNYVIHEGDHDKGMEIYQQLVDLAPDNPFVLKMRAQDARRRHKPREALELYDQVLQQDPEAIEIYNLKGYMYLSLGEYDKAVHALQRYAYYAPDNANPHDSLGEAYLYQGHYEQAIEEFVQALELEPTFLWSGIHLAQALGITGQFHRAERTLDELQPVFEERDQIPWLDTEKLKLAFMAEDWQRLVAMAEAQLPMKDIGSLELADYHVWVNYARTTGYLELGNLEAARAAEADLDTLMSDLRGKMKTYGVWESVYKINHAYIESRFARFEGHPERAIDDLRQAVAESKLSPHELAPFRYELTEALLAAGRPAEAVEVANELLKKIPTAPRMNLLAARAYQALGEREPALQHLRTYLEVMRFADEGNPRVAEATRLLQQMVPRS